MVVIIIMAIIIIIIVIIIIIIIIKTIIYSQFFLGQIPFCLFPTLRLLKDWYVPLIESQSKKAPVLNNKKIRLNLFAINTHLFYLCKTIKKLEQCAGKVIFFLIVQSDVVHMHVNVHGVYWRAVTLTRTKFNMPLGFHPTFQSFLHG